jgi:hypothetical protein
MYFISWLCQVTSDTCTSSLICIKLSSSTCGRLSVFVKRILCDRKWFVFVTCIILHNKGLGAIRAKIGPTFDVDKIFSKICSQHVLFINKYSLLICVLWCQPNFAFWFAAIRIFVFCNKSFIKIPRYLIRQCFKVKLGEWGHLHIFASITGILFC